MAQSPPPDPQSGYGWTYGTGRPDHRPDTDRSPGQDLADTAIGVGVIGCGPIAILFVLGLFCFPIWLVIQAVKYHHVLILLACAGVLFGTLGFLWAKFYRRKHQSSTASANR